ncbi:CarboxypepD_reg-like domain-containing protein [Chitinophaga sp. YR627]|uniref:carboxypeptidase-like regulatory domain-containing protein n=1 Tax=Chitinophaga sp. YR627 TaxID=1881041 RepID=UPI0008E6B5C4|nr:carboxypeptidase-like regulatory domain-containing protein [Chitinophaga sp. YR627]SFN92846.1 CarboxypepD_reg-like domain-containing protein [Chitinophaga sp. YR627]
MKQKDAFILSIPDRCTQPWNEMLPAEDGRFCLSCQKTVTDFTEMTDAEILAYLKRNKGNSCGRFDATQLNRVLQAPPEPSRSIFPAMLLGAMLTAILPEQVYGSNKTPVVTMQPSLRIGGEKRIEGCIMDDAGNALDGVSVRIKDHSSIGGITNREGQFSFTLPESLHKTDSITLQISRLGYDAREVLVNPDQFSGVQVSLSLSIMALPEVVIERSGWATRTIITGAYAGYDGMNYCRNPRWHWWHRLTRVFRKNKNNY